MCEGVHISYVMCYTYKCFGIVLWCLWLSNNVLMLEISKMISALLNCFVVLFLHFLNIFHHLAFLLFSGISALSLNSLSLWHCHCWIFIRVLLDYYTTSPSTSQPSGLTSTSALTNSLSIIFRLLLTITTPSSAVIIKQQLSPFLACSYSRTYLWCMSSVCYWELYDTFSEGPHCLYYIITILMGSIYYTWVKNKEVNQRYGANG